MHAKGQDIVATANSLLGVKYRHQGRNLAGLDCVGVPIYIGAALGIKEWDTTSYSSRPNIKEFLRLIRDTGSTEVPLAQMANGDMLQMNYHGWPVHVGIYEKDEKGNEYIIHAFARHRCVTRDPLTVEQKAKIKSVWRFPE